MALGKRIFPALFVNELFFEKYASKIRKCWSFSIRFSMFDFYFFLLGALGQGLTTIYAKAEIFKASLKI